jgi:hypothetical protein
MSSLFFDFKGIVHNDFILAGKTVNCAYYCDALRLLLEDVRSLHPELRRQNNWLLHQDNSPFHTSSSPGVFFYQKQRDCRPPTTLLFSFFFRLKIKLKGRHIDTIEVIEAELLAVLNISTEHEFQGCI